MDSQRGPASGGIVRQIAARMCVLWPTKAIGLGIGLTAFFAAYFRLLYHPIFSVTIVPLTAVDHLVGFHPWALPLYLSLWFYVSLGFGLLVDRRSLLRQGLAATALSAVGLGIFLVWPTAIPDLGIDWDAHPSFAFLKEVDASGNVCPSLHVAFAVFTAIRIVPTLAEMRVPAAMRAASWLWCLGIVYSTVATGQHVVLDVIAGALLGALAAWAWPTLRLAPAHSC